MLCAYSLYPSLILLLPTLPQAHITDHTHLDDHDLPHPADTSCHPNPCPQTYQCFDSKPSEYRVYCKCRHAPVLLLNTIQIIQSSVLNQIFRPGFIGDGVNSCRRAPTQPPPPPPPPRNPCIGACGYNARCKVKKTLSSKTLTFQVVNGVAACACPAGYTGNPTHHCHRHD